MRASGRLFVLFVSVACELTAAHASAAPPTADACATASDKAQPLRKAGSLRAARYQLVTCANKACPTFLHDDCTAQLGEVEKAMPTVVFAATDSAGQDLTAVRVTMDGDVVAERLEGTGVALDPGEHLFRFETAGEPPVTKRLVLRETEKERRVGVVFGPAGLSVASDEVVGRPSPGGGRVTTTDWPAYLAFAVAGVGLGVGIGWLVVAENNKLTATSVPFSSKYADNYSATRLDNEEKNWLVTGIGFGVAAAGAAIGTCILLASGPLSPKTQPVPAPVIRVQARVAPGWFGLTGQFR